MNIHSPLSNFVKVLREVKNKAQLFSSELGKNEASTRSALIDPVLIALGWDIANPNMVEFEKTFPNSRVDFALYNSDQKIEIIIEAKALSGHLADKKILVNLVTYSMISGVKQLFLTDGIVWEHYTDFTIGNVGSTHSIDLLKDDLVECADYLVRKLDAAKYWGIDDFSKTETNLEPYVRQLNSLQRELSDLKNSIALIKNFSNQEVSATNQIHHIPDAREGTFINLREITEDLSGKNPPSQLRLPGNFVIDVKSWRDVLLQSCLFVLNNAPNIPIPLPDAAGKKIHLLALHPPKKGVSYYSVDINGKNIFIYTNYSANRCVMNALYIFNFLPNNSEPSIEVKFGRYE